MIGYSLILIYFIRYLIDNLDELLNIANTSKMYRDSSSVKNSIHIDATPLQSINEDDNNEDENQHHNFSESSEDDNINSNMAEDDPEDK